jgi:hypothetical protein
MPRLEFAATARNRVPLLDVLREVLPARGRVLEIASGSGEHVTFFAASLPALSWQPSDIEPEHLESVDAWTAHLGLSNVSPAVRLDVTEGPWPPGPFDAVLCANMIHIAPWEATVGLFRGAAEVVPPGGLVVTYGPYRVGGAHTAASNAAFHASLLARDPRWGVRDIDEVAAVATGFQLERRIGMPANNMTLVWRRG